MLKEKNILEEKILKTLNKNMRCVQKSTYHFPTVSAGLPAFQLGLLAF
jgi:hypothetical protein